MKPSIKKFLICIAIPLLTGGIAGLFTRSGTQAYASITKPPLSPPGFIFPIVWTVLYILMGISSYLIWTKADGTSASARAKNLYFYQLVTNFLWSFFFFCFQWYFFSFLWILLLWGLVAAMIKAFSGISKAAAYINLPYLLWLTFAAYLNFGVWWLNR